MKKGNTKAQSQRPPSTGKDAKNSVTKSLTQGATSLEDFEDILLDINIKKPRNAFNYFIMDMKEKHNITGSITSVTADFAKKYRDLSKSEVAKYEKMADEDKIRYEEHMNLVKKYVLDKPFKEKATPYSIYIDEKVREAREKGIEDIKEFKKIKKAEWENDMSLEERKEYKEKLERHFEFYNDIRKSTRPPNAYALFAQDQMAKAREKDEPITFIQVAEIWKNTSKAVKERYAVYANEVAEDAKKHRHLYELAYGLKPKLPVSAFRFYYQDAIQKEIVSGKGALKKARELFEKMKEDDKVPYLKLAKKEKLAYMIKKREYESKNKKTRTPTAYNLFVSDLKGTDPKKFSETGFFNYTYKRWKNLDKERKSEYESKAKKLKEENDLEYEDSRRSLQKSAPKKPLSAYNLFIRERLPELKKENPDLEQTEFFGMIAEEYSKLSDSELRKLQKKADKEKERYEKEKAQYEVEMSQTNLTQLEKAEEGKDKRREARSKTKEKNETRGRSKSRNQSRSKTVSQENSEDESEMENTQKKSKKDKKAREEKSKKKNDDSDDDRRATKPKRAQSKKGKNTGK